MTTMTEWMDLRRSHDENGNNPSLLDPGDKAKIDDGDWLRAGGECVCQACGKEYRVHPPVVGAIWLLRLCGGGLIKT